MRMDLESRFERQSKGKLTMEGIKLDGKIMSQEEKNQCGICFSEGDKAIRGWIDSCSHYFCFVCIMEWAKIESRCPMCKRRFTTIRRPAKDGVFACERVVDVPVRNQAFHPLGNVTVGPVDPYADTKCSVCGGSSDDHLLLLCDLCDSASHTYCVGLGNTVPDGDWFCSDCTLSQNEHAGEGENKLDNACTSTSGELHGPQEASHAEDVTSVGSLRISPTGELHGSLEAPHAKNMTSASNLRTSATGELHGSHAENETSVGENMTSTADTDARTLHRCREVHSRIQALRDNWHALQTGSLTFASSSLENVSTGPKNVDTKKIAKAWKMMELARSMRPRPSDQSSGLKKPTNSPSERHVFRTQDVEKAYPHKGRVIMMESSEHANFFPPSQRISSNVKTCTETSSSSASSHRPENHKSLEFGSYERRIRESAGSESQSSSCRPMMENRTRPVFGADERRRESTKSEIKSLVKLNLKLLNKGKQLGGDAFKQVARRATHTILARCGLEKSTIEQSIYTQLVCRHDVLPDELDKRSTLMPSSCRKCFYAFVESTVNDVMLDILKSHMR